MDLDLNFCPPELSNNAYLFLNVKDEVITRCILRLLPLVMVPGVKTSNCKTTEDIDKIAEKTVKTFEDKERFDLAESLEIQLGPNKMDYEKQIEFDVFNFFVCCVFFFFFFHYKFECSLSF